MSEAVTVPVLRFPEFEGDWEEKRLGALVSSVSSGRSSHSEVGDFPVHGSTGQIGWASNHDYEGPAILVARVGANAGKLNHVSGQYGVTDNTLILPVIDGADQQFIFAFLTNVNLNRYVFGSGQPLITGSLLKRVKGHFPSLPEQKKIAAFLGVVDAKLTALRERVALLERYKRGLMQALFSQSLRFTKPDGTAFPDWEEKRLGEVAEIVGGGTPDTNVAEYWNGEVDWFTPSEIKKKYLTTSKRKISKQGLTSSSAKMLPVGALILSTRATVGDVGIATIECATNQGFQSLVMKGVNSNEFWYYWLLHNKKALLRRSAGSTFLEIGKSEVQKLPVVTPHPDEQQKIADALSAIDTKIAAVADQVAQMDQFKKGLLQQMFV